jgi:hypothetical protein
MFWLILKKLVLGGYTAGRFSKADICRTSLRYFGISEQPPYRLAEEFVQAFKCSGW